MTPAALVGLVRRSCALFGEAGDDEFAGLEAAFAGHGGQFVTQWLARGRDQRTPARQGRGDGRDHVGRDGEPEGHAETAVERRRDQVREELSPGQVGSVRRGQLMQQRAGAR